METLVRRAITTIRERYEEPLSLDDLARTATMSKFHFLRSFRNVTGVTPLRFLSAVRIQEAKRLLLTTQLDVAAISSQVGYGSLGTFTRRFTECVGLPPTQYRRMVRGWVPTGMPPRPRVEGGPNTGAITGTVYPTRRPQAMIFLGAFPTRIPQGQPAACAALTRPGQWCMPAVPPGSWYLLAVTVAERRPDDPVLPGGEPPLLIGTVGPVQVEPGARAYVDVTIRPQDWAHPPLLFALPGIEVLRTGALQAA